MAGKKGDNTKKVAGNAKKAEVAAQKQAATDARQAATEEQKWAQGSKDTAKREAAAAKAADAARKKAEKEALLAEEEKSQRAVPKGANAKKAEKKLRGTLDLGQLDDSAPAANEFKKPTALNASNIDDALDALSLTQNSPEATKLDRHPERRFKAAYKAFEERRLPEIEDENPGLRKQQRVEIVRKEFEKSPENPFNMVGNVRFDSSRDEMEEVRRRARDGVEGRLGEKS